MEKENIYAIKVTNLKKAYQDKHVLNGVHFQVKKGTIFCLLGSNGAGKTTTVKILSTLITQDEGQASVCQYDVKKEAAMVRKSISLTGQYAAVDEILTGFENMEMVARLCHVLNPKKHAMQLLRDFQLEDAKDRRVSTYSGGMRRRLDIAMSLTGHLKASKTRLSSSPPICIKSRATWAIMKRPLKWQRTLPAPKLS